MKSNNRIQNIDKMVSSTFRRNLGTMALSTSKRNLEQRPYLRLDVTWAQWPYLRLNVTWAQWPYLRLNVTWAQRPYLRLDVDKMYFLTFCQAFGQIVLNFNSDPSFSKRGYEDSQKSLAKGSYGIPPKN